MIQKLLKWKSLRFEDKIQALEELANHPSKEAIMESICNQNEIESFVLDNNLFYFINKLDINIDLDDFCVACEKVPLDALKELVSKVKQFEDGYLIVEPSDQYDLIFHCSEDLNTGNDKVNFLLSIFDMIYQDTIRAIFEYSTICSDDIVEYSSKMTLRAKIELARKTLNPEMLDYLVTNIPSNQLRTIISEAFVNFCLCNKSKVVDFIYNLYEEKVEEIEEKIRDL